MFLVSILYHKFKNLYLYFPEAFSHLEYLAKISLCLELYTWRLMPWKRQKSWSCRNVYHLNAWEELCNETPALWLLVVCQGGFFPYLSS